MIEHPTSVRLDDETLLRLDRVATALTKRSAGLAVGRSRTLKLAVERGLAALEAELGLVKRKR